MLVLLSGSHVFLLLKQTLWKRLCDKRYWPFLGSSNLPLFLSPLSETNFLCHLTLKGTLKSMYLKSFFLSANTISGLKKNFQKLSLFASIPFLLLFMPLYNFVFNRLICTKQGYVWWFFGLFLFLYFLVSEERNWKDLSDKILIP